MAETTYIGAIDQGTTGTRFMVFDQGGTPVARAHREHRQIFPQAGWVEHDPREIWASTVAVCNEALDAAGIAPDRIAAIGITNQRETTLVWDAQTGAPLHNAIVWQDRRTADRCAQLERDGLAGTIRAKTGLPPDPYFSATKLEWLLANVPGLRERAEDGSALFGTVDAYLIWKLTGAHVTDPTNASRTMLFNLHDLEWDAELLDLFGVPRAMMPAVVSSAEVYGQVRRTALGDAWDGVPVAGDLGDQQAALFGQAGFAAGDAKNTYGTGSFLLKNTGPRAVSSESGLLTTIAYCLPGRPVHYALEGSIFVTGAAIQWLRDGPGIIESAEETAALAESVPDTDGVYLVPAFVGLGAPHWDPYARGTVVGITRGTSRAHLARAALEAVAYQTCDVFDAMATDLGPEETALHSLKVDGGAAANDFLCRFQSDVLGVPLVRPVVTETTALGAAFAAGLAVGYWRDLEELGALWQADRTFEPTMDDTERERLLAGWQRAVRCALAWAADREA